ncbi:SIN3-HDAC complex-associated factor-like [Lytechinus variegatus]|uniref:SIN3-HDAC complex-associated factor-like n=1 Tax=Lytechinus variegatus TaxID=7654 RepID=UPI001BB1D939|nr:SIN3-HDAC complex-associated factor-like [Lytechinus variegatus]XP_041452664.1 SIN3-HDAC complex-associated factor-like [Lytechinus variegatus]
MFTFHRPKIYRSVAGCCICKAKSSSSRFTDSKKYEMEFKDCFNLVEGQKRTGEICNACVLLIKRWKKLPKGTERNWNHVVDARAGPGGKSQLRHKLKTQKTTPTNLYSNNCNNNNPGSVVSEHGWSRRNKRRHAERKKRMQLLDGLRTRSHPDTEDASPPSPTPSDTSDTSVVSQPGSRTGSISSEDLDELPPLLASIIDTSYWKMEKICCGTIFKGVRGEIMIHPQLLRPCATSCLGSGVKPRSNPSPAHRSPADPALSCNKGVVSDAITTVTNKRGTRQDSVGSEGSNESSESDDLSLSRSREVKGQRLAGSGIIDDIMETC